MSIMSFDKFKKAMEADQLRTEQRPGPIMQRREEEPGRYERDMNNAGVLTFEQFKDAQASGTNFDDYLTQRLGTSSDASSLPSVTPAAPAVDNRTDLQKMADRVLGIDRSQVTGEKTDWGKLLGGTLAKGYTQWADNFWKTANFILDEPAQDVHDLGTTMVNGAIDLLNNIPGVDIKELDYTDNFIRRAYNTSKATTKQLQDAYQQNANSSMAAQIVDNFGTSTVAALPFAIEAMITAPAQAARLGQATTAGLQYFSGLQNAQGIEAFSAMAKQGFSELMKNPQFWTSYLQVAGEGYENALEDGMEDADAALYGLVNGFFNAMIEVGGADEALGGIQNLPMRLQEQGGKMAVVDWVKDAVLGEGLEEVNQGITERALKGLSGRNVPIASLDPGDQDAILNPWTAAQEFTGGAVVGAVLGGAQTGINAGITKTNRAIINREINRQEKARNRQAVMQNVIERVAGQQNAEIGEADRAALAGIYDAEQNGTNGEAAASALVEAYRLGKEGKMTAEEARKESKSGARLSAEQFERAFSLGQGTEAVETRAVDASTEEGKTALTAALASLGTQAETAAATYEEGQDVDTFAAAMSQAAGYAANGGDVKALAQAARDGETGSRTLAALSDKQIEAAQQIGEQMRQARETDTQARIERRAEINRQAEAILEQEIPEMGEINATIRDVTDFRAQEQQELASVQKEMAAMREANPEAEASEAYQNAQERAARLEEALENDGQILDQLKAARKEARGKAKRTAGRAIYESAEGKVGDLRYKAADRSKFSQTQKATARIAETIARVSGLDIHIADFGQGVGGAYLRGEGGVLYLNINASFNGANISIGSLCHELTHWMQEYAPEEYAELKRVVMDEISRDPKAYAEIFGERSATQQKLSPDEISDEMVANACQTVLMDEESVKRIVQQHRNLAEKLRDFILRTVDRLKAAFSEINAAKGFPLYKEVRAAEKSLDRMREIWLRAFETASENLQAEKTVERAKPEQTAQAEEKAAGEGDAQMQTWDNGEYADEYRTLTEGKSIDELYDAMQQRGAELRTVREQLRERKPEFDRRLDESVKNASGALPERVEAFNRWLSESGYEELDNQQKKMDREYRMLRDAYDKANDAKLEADEKASIEKSGLTESEYFGKQAVKEFGYTPYFYDAGYILPNGKMLNFSGQKGKHFGSRGQDHRTIGTIFATTSQTEAMLRFMGYGNIRIMAESPGLDITSGTEPTPEQYRQMRAFIRSVSEEEYFNVDLTDERGNTIGNLEYEGTIRPDRIINDIKHFYQTGEVRDTGMSAFYQRWDNDYMTAVENGDMEEAQRLVDQAAETSGYKYHGYHGTLATDFTEFKKEFIGTRFSFDEKGFFFIDRESIANDYASSEFSSKKGRVIDAYLRIRKPFVIDKAFALKDGLGNIYRDNDVIDVWDNYSSYFLEQAEVRRADGIILDDGSTKMFVVFDGQQIKSAEPVTRDNNGNVIPLSDRFNRFEKDFRFQRWDDTNDDTAAEKAGREIAYARLQSENAILAQTVAEMKKLTGKQGKTIAALQKRLQITKTPETRSRDARNLAKTLITEANSKADLDSVAEKIKEIGDYLLQTETDKLSEETLKNKARSAAREIVESATEQVGIEEDIARQIAGDLRGRKLSIDEYFLGELDSAGGYETFRKRLFGRLTLAKRESKSTEGREGYSTVTQAYDDLQSKYGKAYFPDVANEGEQVQILAELLYASQPMEVNPYEQYMGEVVEDVANRIVMDAMNGVLRANPPTTADKQKARTKALQEHIKELQAEDKLQQREAASLYNTIYDLSLALDKAESKYKTLKNGSQRRLAEVQAEGKARAAEIKASERARATEDIQALREHYQDMATRARQGRRSTAIRNKIRKLINDLNAKLAKPSESRYIPSKMVQLTIDTLEMIDLGTGRSAKVAEKLANIRAMYERYKDDWQYAIIYDKVSAQMLSNLETEIRGTKLSDMNERQLNAVYETLKSLNHVISKAVNVKIGEEEHNAFELSKAMTTETREIPKAQTSWLKNKWLVSHLRADVMFSRFGGHKKNSTWSQIGRMLNDGQLKQTGIKMELSRPFAELINDRKGMEDFIGTNYFGKIQQDKLVDIGLKDESGNAIRVTHDIMVGIYMDLLNEDNRKHFIRGGKTVPSLQEFYDGKGSFEGKEKTAVGIAAQLSDLQHDLAEARRGNYEEWAEDLQNQIDALLSEGEQYADEVKANIEKHLTDFDRKWIKATQQLMDQDSKHYLNETTMEVYGIEKARVDHYFPITVDPDFLTASFDSVSKDMSLENVGFLKDRVQSSKPTLALGTFSVVNKQIDRVAQYCGLMPAIRNFQKILNKSDFGYQDSLKKALRSKFGGEAMKYLDGLIADLSGSRGTESDTIGISKLLGKLRGNLAQTTLTLNVRVALAQAASYPTAAAELDAKSLTKAFFKGGKSGRMISRADQELIAKWSPLLWLRMHGYSTQELGDIKNNNSAQAKIWKKLRWATGWIQAVDGATVGRLWYATEYWVQEHMPSLEKGSDKYYEAVAKKFNDVVEKTQPNYTTMQRATILREPSSVLKMFTMFMTQRLQNFNILYDSTARYQKARADLAAGRNGITKADVLEAKETMVRSVCSQIAQAAVYVGFKLFADALLHSMKKWRDKETGNLTAESISLQLLDGFADALIGSTIGGSEIYSILKALTGRETWYGLSLSGVDSVNDLIEDLVALANVKDPVKRRAKVLNVAKSGAQVMGIPLNNGIKIAQAIIYHIDDLANRNPWQTAGFEKTSKQEKMSNLAEAGVSSKEYASFVQKSDTDGNGSIKQEEAGAYLSAEIEAGRMTQEKAEALWSAATTGKTTFPQWQEKNSGKTSLQPTPAAPKAETKTQTMPEPDEEDEYTTFKKTAPVYSEKAESAYMQWEDTVKPLGISLERYTDFLIQADTDGNGSVKQDEFGTVLQAAVYRKEISLEQANAMWGTLWKGTGRSKSFEKWLDGQS